jgi:hypothetical protein
MTENFLGILASGFKGWQGESPQDAAMHNTDLCKCLQVLGQLISI